MELTERQEAILRHIVEAYITTARPVGSVSVVKDCGLSVSSATVRNEMAVLEELGLIRQLHTSGGRVPTNAGYQFYVERLMRPGHLPTSEAHTIRHQFHQAHPDVEEWLKLAATVMANRLHNVGLVTAPRSSEIRLRHLEVISIQPAVALLIVVLQDGAVVQEMLVLPEVYAQEELSSLSDRLSGDFQGQTAAQIERKLRTLPEPARTVAGLVVELLRRKGAQSTEVFHAGLSDLMEQPEFLARRPGEPPALMHERLRHMVEFLQHGFAVDRFLAGLGPEFDVQIVIGGNGVDAGLREYSFVLGRYGDQSDSTGFLGIVGPTRMEYPRAVALVRYMRDLMTDLMEAY